MLLAGLLFITSCDSGAGGKEGENSPEIGNYIVAYTSGVISAEAEIIIRLADAYPAAANYYEPIGKKIFEFDPAVAGKSYWINQYTLGFKPDEKFKHGEIYKANLLLSELFDISGQLEKFHFSFQTRVLDFRLNIGSLKPYPGQAKYYSLTGDLDFSDAFDPLMADKLFQAKQDDAFLSVQWKSMQNNRVMKFTVDSIERREHEGELCLYWDGSSAGIENKGSDTIVIPSLHDFELLNVRVFQLPSQRVLLSFSDQLKGDQMLDGLVSLDGNDDLKFKIHGSELEVYFDQNLQGVIGLVIEPGIKGISGAKIDKRIERKVNFSRLKPQISLLNEGVILPSTQGLTLPFKAVGLNAVDVKIIKIYENNIPQFLQVNRLNADYQIRRVGRPVLKHTVDLASTGLDMNTWNFFSLDLSELITPDPGAIYNIEFMFFQGYSSYECPGATASETDQFTGNEDNWGYEEASNWDNPDYYYYGYWPDGYNWRERDNPCHVSYYNSRRFISTNILASDLGLIVKSGAGREILAAASDLVSAEPLSGVSIEIFNYQLQKIGGGSTGMDGLAEIKTDGSPFILVASKDKQKGYLRIDDGSALSVSDFDVSGRKVKNGIRGFIYGDRGVWRPGDTLFLNFILDDREMRLPKEHPVVFELLNPFGRVIKRRVNNTPVGNIFKLALNTDASSPTGLWRVRVKVGGVTFSKSLRIETVKPNRLKIKFDMGKGPLRGGVWEKGMLSVNWLHGAAGRNLKVQADITLYKSNKGFEQFPGFYFSDPSINFYPDEMVLFEGRVNNQGEAIVNFQPPEIANAPGMLEAAFSIRAFEEGGEFSTDFFNMDYAPYKTFVGLRLPEGDKRGMLLTDTTHSVRIITCDAEGKPKPVQGLQAAVYKVSWRWWWNATDNDMASYFGSSYAVPVAEDVIHTNKDGKGIFNFKIEYPEWGRYFVRIWDPDGGSSTGKTVYVDWPGWAGQAKREFPGAASLLTFTSDKTNYKVGETATIIFPSAGQGRALVTIESGSEILNAEWIKPEGRQSSYSFKITPEMAPNVYVGITLVQPHGQQDNDAPMRLYGVMPIMVEDPGSKITPVMEMADELEPEKEVKIEVYEENGMPMSYTIAMVDEGLLDLTRFKTPNPWRHFYAREALGVKTWDLYSYVLGAYGGKLEKVFGIGGGGEIEEVKDLKANRFKPVVKFLGPFYLEKGETASHSFVMPNYVGSVRTMLVAAGEMAYGSAQKTTVVKKPLMLLATLPRVLGPGEEVALPVTVFAMDEDVKNVRLLVKTNAMFTNGQMSREIHFDQSGDQVISFNLKTVESIGFGKVEIEAESGDHKASYAIEIDIRNPNPPVVNFFNKKLAPGEEYTLQESLPGLEGSNTAVLEVSALMPIDLDRRLRYLISYPHGCLEQVVSGAFPQLYLPGLMELSDNMEKQITANIRGALNKMVAFQSGGGGLSLWPNGKVSSWTTSYAGHFFLEAEKQGYTLPVGLKNSWLSFQKSMAAEWSVDDDYRYNRGLNQAYRLYTLSLAGTPDLRAMNRLREVPLICAAARWQLVAAYILAGQPEAAKTISASANYEVKDYSAFDQTYGSSSRDLALILQSLCLMDEKDKAYPLARKISHSLSGRYWMNTQTTAFCLMAMAAYYEGEAVKSSGMLFSYQLGDGEKSDVGNDYSLVQLQLDVEDKQAIRLSVTNNDDKALHVNLMMRGNPLIDSTRDVDNNIAMVVRYLNMAGEIIDPTRLVQGTDFVAEIKISSAGIYQKYRDLALTQIFPSGWEIINKRMHDIPDVMSENTYEYRDIRDDRVITYFSMYRKGTVKYTVLLNAAYVGRYYKPGSQCEAMYNNDIYARRTGEWVEVVKPE